MAPSHKFIPCPFKPLNATFPHEMILATVLLYLRMSMIQTPLENTGLFKHCYGLKKENNLNAHVIYQSETEHDFNFKAVHLLLDK